MPVIETQGLSEDYRTATGSYDNIVRGDIPKDKLLEILKIISKLSVPSGEDDCPPTINVSLVSDNYFTCFFGDGGVIRCTDSRHSKMTPEEAVKIICGEISLEDYDQSKGYRPRKGSFTPVVIMIAILLIVIVVAGLVW